MSAGTKSGRHAQRPATKEFFVPCSAGLETAGNMDPTVVGDMYHGYYLHTNVADSAFIVFFVPHDFEQLVELAIAFIARATSAMMGFAIEVEYAKKDKGFGTNWGGGNFRMPTTLDDIHELDITRLIPVSNVAPLEDGHYIAIKVEYTADPNATDALILGARFRYK